MSHFLSRDRCPACQSGDTEILYECSFLDSPIKDYLQRFYARHGGPEFEYLREAAYILDECQSCSLVFQRQVPDDFLMRRLYEGWIKPDVDFEEFRQNGNLPRFSRYLTEIMVVIAYLGRPARELKILDFGMGWGRWCYLARALDCEVHGAEVSQSRIDYARSRGVEAIDPGKLPREQFDFINSEQVFEHLPDPLSTLRRLVAALHPNGLVKVSVPNGKRIKRNLRIGDWTSEKGSRDSLNLVSPLEHINCYQRESLIRMARLAGLRAVPMPLGLQLAFTGNWRGTKQVFRNLAWPIYKNVLRRGTYLFFEKEVA